MTIVSTKKQIPKKTSAETVHRPLNSTKNYQSDIKENYETVSSPNYKKNGLKFDRVYTKKGTHPFETIEWEKRDAIIKNMKGEAVYEQKNIEVPKSWSLNATNIATSKYFYGKGEKRENSIKQLIDRVTRTIADWGKEDGYFASKEDAESFYSELTHLCVNQYGAFNSPVWFNCGVHRYDTGSGTGRYYWNTEKQEVLEADDNYTHPQCSACFINSVKDTMSSILGLTKTEGMLFKFGSGAGVNLSPIRSSMEALSGGGEASGPVSFMKGFDAFAGVIKSGGKTRRAAKMICMDISHPDIMEFIECKEKEEKKIHALVEAGYDGSFDGEASRSVFFQNANHSIRVTDEFMELCEDNQNWDTKAVSDGRTIESKPALGYLKKISEATWRCGDPGLQYDTTINNWHTCSATDRIYASNPCSEYMFLNDSACNLASLNLIKFRKDNGTFATEEFKHAIRLFTTAQEIIVDRASYPVKNIAQNSHNYRPLGLGYANIGSLLMSFGLPYDSEAGRAWAAGITAILTGESYHQSAIMAQVLGPFPHYEKNKKSVMRIMRKHKRALNNIKKEYIQKDVMTTAQECWNNVVELGDKHGLRNAQASVLAPTGTIGLMMDCATTGIEPELALVKYKSLMGGGNMKFINTTVSQALSKLNYSNDQIKEISKHIENKDTIENAPHLKEEDLLVFDCAFKPLNGKRFIHYMGHIKMMATVQSFISGAISKTVNMPEESTVKDVIDAYTQGWKLGIKALAIYRDGSKGAQPLSTKKAEEKSESKKEVVIGPYRKKLEDERESITHKFTIGGHKGYITVGMYENGQPGEIFITMAKEGSTISGLMDAFATSTSLNLQYGVPLKILINKFSHVRFEPSGFTNNKEIPMVKSIMDYIFRWLALKFLAKEEASEFHTATRIKDKINEIDKKEETAPSSEPQQSQKKEGEKQEYAEPITFKNHEDAIACHVCGSTMVRNGSCYKCDNCGATSGCS